MGDPPPPRKPRFHAPVVASYMGDATAVSSLVNRLATLPTTGLGTSVEVITSGSQCVSVDPGWSERARDRDGRRRVVRGGAWVRSAPAVASAGDKTRSTKRPWTASSAALSPPLGVDAGDDVMEDHHCPPGAIPRRPSSGRAAAHLIDKRIMEALGPCVRNACGLPSATPIGKSASLVSATLVGDPNSHSRAILLCVGCGKADSAILWASRRGGILCSCFAGTQNALFLSASSRSCVCKHTRALRRCLVKEGIALSLFLRRMHLGSSPTNFVSQKRYGPMQFWVVLYRSVYSLVSFSAANMATCIALSFWRFRALCGHVALARPRNMNSRAADVAAGVKPGTPLAPVKAASANQPLLPLGLADEDDGIETEPCDTERGSGDAAESTVSARVRRNLLPCKRKIADAEVWARTAEWRGIAALRRLRGGANKAGDIKKVEAVMKSAAQMGLMHGRGLVPVEPYCGSCGSEREKKHVVTKERAVLYTHHATAPAIQVCFDSSFAWCSTRSVLPCFLCGVGMLRFVVCQLCISDTRLSFGFGPCACVTRAVA